MKERILTWDFFLSRFDTLSLEAQVDLESTGDITCPTGKYGQQVKSPQYTGDS